MVLGTRRPASLTSRLVATVAALVVGFSLLAGAVTAFAVDRYLTDRLDDRVLAALDRARNAPAFGEPRADLTRPDDPRQRDLDDRRGQAIGTLTAIIPAAGAEGSQERRGDVIVDDGDGPADRAPLPDADLAELANVPVDGGPHEVELPEGGSFRVAVADEGTVRVVSGLPSAEVEEVVAVLLTIELALLGAGASAAIGAAVLLVRRQLRPLRELASTADAVAGLPLATDPVDLRDRVPPRLRDRHTEVGQVGVALAEMLRHVGTSLEARRRSEDQVRRFVADASHELRTPLTTIGGYVQLARRRPHDEAAQRTALAKVDEESARMTALVEDLLLLARLDSGRPLEQGAVDISRLLLEAVADARVVAADHVWRVDLPDDAVEVDGDELRLHQVVTNLLANARAYTPAGTTVTVRVVRRADDVVVTVHDDGPGFDPDAAAHAFERFARGDPARHRTSDAGGVGLGLALVRAIITAHDGTVTLESRPGDTTVRVVLPVGEAAAGSSGGSGQPSTVEA